MRYPPNSVEAGADKVEISVGLNEKNVELKIKDNGKGIPKELLSDLGKKGRSSGKEDGSGLGLYHAKTNIERWGGRLTIESEPNKGAEVTITLPTVDKSLNVKAILIDDDPLVRKNWEIAAKNAGVSLKAYKDPPWG
ncbi:MAG: sensor histidine kinase [Elusimicrobia bacterium]|nr:sensor histidine kinase [Elusimicrobiota bacterium]